MVEASSAVRCRPGCYARGGGDSGRDERAIAVGATAPRHHQVRKRLRRPSRRQHAGAAGQRHEHRICRRAERCASCIRSCLRRSCDASDTAVRAGVPGSSPASSAAVGTSLQQNMIGAAATVAIWHVSHAQISHDSRRRIEEHERLELTMGFDMMGRRPLSFRSIQFLVLLGIPLCRCRPGSRRRITITSRRTRRIPTPPGPGRPTPT